MPLKMERTKLVSGRVLLAALEIGRVREERRYTGPHGAVILTRNIVKLNLNGSGRMRHFTEDISERNELLKGLKGNDMKIFTQKTMIDYARQLETAGKLSNGIELRVMLEHMEIDPSDEKLAGAFTQALEGLKEVRAIGRRYEENAGQL
jgi:hypothetical protein